MLHPSEAEAARNSIEGLLYSTTKAEYGWQPTPFHLLLAVIAYNVAMRKPGWRRVILSTPPQHGKSETNSRGLPSWFLGRFPKLFIILACYGADFAAEWGAKVRDTLLQFGEQVFGIRLRRDIRSASRFKVAGHGGEMITAGCRGRITGKGMDLGLIDDPVKNDEEAASPVYQRKTWEWYKATFRTRLRRGGSILLTMTRWNENDLAGKLIAEMAAGGEVFLVICLPAIAEEFEDWSTWGVAHTREPGDALCPELHSAEELAIVRRAIGEYWWAALYQGSPRPDGGSIFKRWWFRSWFPFDWQGDIPQDSEGQKVKGEGDYSGRSLGGCYLPYEFDYVVASWDMSFKDLKTSSFCVGSIWGLKDGDHFLLDQIKGQVEFPEACRMVVALHEAWPEAYHTLLEDKANGTAAETILRDIISGIIMIEPCGHKDARARAIASIPESGHTFIPGRGVSTRLGGANWVWGEALGWRDQRVPGAKCWIEEHVDFPNGSFNDQVDSHSQAEEYLRKKQMLGAVPKISEKLSQRLRAATRMEI